MIRSGAVPNDIDAKRTKPRVNLVLDADEREAADRMAAERRVSLSQFIGQLIREEAARAARRSSRT
jgi:uncharacterized protein (DUF1778 family)